VLPEAAAELAEHATDDAFTSREIDVLRPIAARNANKAIASSVLDHAVVFTHQIHMDVNVGDS
jgi:hypothetical protein